MIWLKTTKNVTALAQNWASLLQQQVQPLDWVTFVVSPVNNLRTEARLSFWYIWPWSFSWASR